MEITRHILGASDRVGSRTLEGVSQHGNAKPTHGNARNRQMTKPVEPSSAPAPLNCTNSAARSNVPKMMLKFVRSPGKFCIEMGLLHALANDPDIQKYKTPYEMTFGEPFHTFFEDRRIKLLVSIVDSACRMRQLTFFARCLGDLRRSHVPSLAQDDRSPNAAPSSAGDASWDYEEELNRILHEISTCDRHLRGLLGELHELDPGLAKTVERYAYSE